MHPARDLSRHEQEVANTDMSNITHCNHSTGAVSTSQKKNTINLPIQNIKERGLSVTIVKPAMRNLFQSTHPNLSQKPYILTK